MEQFLAAGRSRAGSTPPGSGPPGLPPRSNESSRPPELVHLPADVGELFEALHVGVGLAIAEQVGLNELLGGQGSDRCSGLCPDDSGGSDASPRQVTTAGATSEPIEDYLKQVDKSGLLTAGQEVELAKRIEAGLYAEQKLKAAGTIDSDLKGELWWIAGDGKDARGHLLEASLRLVVPWAKLYTGRGMPFLDLIQEGNLGLIRAVDKFDYTKGITFSTYATWWIRETIARAMADQARTIRIPVHLVKVINKFAEYERWTKVQEDRVPTVADIAAQFDLTPQKVVEIQSYRRHPMSLHELIPVAWDEIDSPSELTDSGWATELGHLIEDSDPAPTRDAVKSTRQHKDLYSVLGTLSEREAAVVSMRQWNPGVIGPCDNR